jgi:hypothetical protein
MSFHEQFSLFLEKKKRENFLATEKKSLEESIRQINEIDERRTSAFYEEELKSFLSLGDFRKLRLPLSTYPVFIRKLPRFYCRKDPSRTCLKSEFLDLDLLKRRLLDKVLFSLYEKKEMAPAKICLISWVFPGGVGDYYATIEAAKVLKENIPSLEIHLIVVSDRKASLSPPKNNAFSLHTLSYEDRKEDLPLFSTELFSRAELILQIPMFYPPLSRVQEELLKKSAQPPAFDLVREYGFISSTWLSPPPLSKSMGIDPLEMGIFIKKLKFDESVFVSLMQRLKVILDPKMRRPFFGYLVTERGCEAFLHALLTYTIEDKRGIDLFVHQMGSFLLLFPKIKKALCSYGLSEIVFHTSEKTKTIPLSSSGKSLRLIHTGNLSHEEFQSLLLSCDAFSACRGDQSFSEMVCANKIFFYDGLLHSVNFLKDLVALCQTLLPSYSSTIEYLQLFLKNMAPFWKDDSAEWVEEEFFEYSMELSAEQVGRKMGLLLRKEKTQEGMEKLNHLLKENYDISSYLTGMVKRILLHRRCPDLAQEEQSLVSRVLLEKKFFPSMIRKIRTLAWRN